jgi:hypothetical protein
VIVSGNYATESAFVFHKPSVGRSEIIPSVFTPRRDANRVLHHCRLPLRASAMEGGVEGRRNRDEAAGEGKW